MPTWFSDYIQYKALDEIIYPFPNFKYAAVDALERISISIPHLS